MASSLATSFNVADTYKEVYYGNLRLLMSVKAESIEEIIKLICIENQEHSRRDPATATFGDKLIELLTLLCACDETPLSGQQALILQRFVQQERGLLVQVERRGLEIWLLYKGLQVNVFTFKGKFKRIVMDGGGTNPFEHLYAYFIRCWELFVAICIGRNRFACDYLISQATYT